MWRAADAAGGQPALWVWITQAATVVISLASGWFALKSKRVDADEVRRARFDARVDKELDDAVAENQRLRADYNREYLLRLRYEGWLIRHGIDLETGRREADA